MPPPVVTPVVTPAAPTAVLAVTGSDGRTAATAMALVLLGSGLLLGARRLRRVS